MQHARPGEPVTESSAEFWAQLLKQLAPELNAHLPSRVAVETDQRGLFVRVDGEIAQRTDYALLEGSDAEGTLEVLLSGIQDLVIRHTHRKWPDSGHDVHERDFELLTPYASISGGSVRLWFARADNDVDVHEIASILLTGIR